MARARNIKPGFFANDQLAEIEPAGRLLFIGLWTLADREGRLEDRPKKIRAQLFPYDDLNVDALLAKLTDSGFLLRYSVAGKSCIQVLNFTKHQMPHHKEPASEIPPPDGHEAVTKHPYDVSTNLRAAIFERDGNRCLKCGAVDALSIDHILPLAKGGNNSESNLQTLCKRCNSAKGGTTKDHRDTNVEPTLTQRSAVEGAPCPSDSGFLIPDPPSLIPDSLQPHCADRDASVAAVPGFEAFWEVYPNTGRKVGKGKALAHWRSKRLEPQADLIASHVLAMRGTEQWRNGYEPTPITYLSQQRWMDPVPRAGPRNEARAYLEATLNGGGDGAGSQAVASDDAGALRRRVQAEMARVFPEGDGRALVPKVCA